MLRKRHDAEGDQRIEMHFIGDDGAPIDQPAAATEADWSFARIFGRPEDRRDLFEPTQEARDHTPRGGPSNARAGTADVRGRGFGARAAATRRHPLGVAAGNGEEMQRNRRNGCAEEILVTMIAHPTVAGQSAVDSLALTASRRLRIDPATLTTNGSQLAWSASLRTLLWRRRDATLRLYGSPSSNVTILTLTPKRPHKNATRSFIRAGLRTMTDLRDRLDRCVDISASGVASGGPRTHPLASAPD
jgi:hypothetical protein